MSRRFIALVFISLFTVLGICTILMMNENMVTVNAEQSLYLYVGQPKDASIKNGEETRIILLKTTEYGTAELGYFYNSYWRAGATSEIMTVHYGGKLYIDTLYTVEYIGYDYIWLVKQ